MGYLRWRTAMSSLLQLAFMLPRCVADLGDSSALAVGDREAELDRLGAADPLDHDRIIARLQVYVRRPRSGADLRAEDLAVEATEDQRSVQPDLDAAVRVRDQASG